MRARAVPGRGKLCPYAQLLGQCPMQINDRCFMCPENARGGHTQMTQSAADRCGCSCCRALVQVQQREHRDVRSRLHDFMQLPTPRRPQHCQCWATDEPAAKVDEVAAAFA